MWEDRLSGVAALMMKTVQLSDVKSFIFTMFTHVNLNLLDILSLCLYLLQGRLVDSFQSEIARIKQTLTWDLKNNVNLMASLSAAFFK